MKTKLFLLLSTICFTIQINAQELKYEYKSDSTVVYVNPTTYKPNFNKMTILSSNGCDLIYMRNFILNVGKQILSKEQIETVRAEKRRLTITIYMNAEGKVLYAYLRMSKKVFDCLSSQNIKDLYNACTKDYDMNKVYNKLNGDDRKKVLGVKNGYFAYCGLFVFYYDPTVYGD